MPEKIADNNATRTRKLMRDRGICVVIPTYNNHATIRQVVEGALSHCGDVIVVDDGCTDGTSDILKSFGDKITVVAYGQNRGKGHALRGGFLHALSLGFAYAVTLDADGQHYASDIPRFLEANRQHPGALIVGCRNMDNVVLPRSSAFANKFSNFWFYVQTGKRLSDTQTGYRLYPLRKLRWLSLLTSRYEAELELLVFASWHGVEIVSLPIDVFYPPAGERVSHFRPAADFGRISLLNTVLCLLAIVYGLPLRLWRFIAKWGRTAYTLLFFLFASLIVFTPWVWLMTHIGKMNERKRMRLHNLIYKAARFVMITHGIPGTKFSQKVAATADFTRPSVIICNHQSHFDLMCQLVFTPKIVFLTNEWVWNNPFYGILIRNAEYLPVRDGVEALLPQLRSLTQRGYSVAVYPEGTRSRDLSIGRFHQGAFYIARELDLDIIPMCLYGTGRVLRKHTYHLNKGIIHIEVGDPISQEQLSAMGDTRQQASRMRRLYVEKYESMSNQIERYV